MSDEAEPSVPTWKRVLVGILDIVTAFLVFGFLIGWLTGNLSESAGFVLNGVSAIVLFGLVIAYIVLGNVLFGGTIWKRIFRIPGWK